VYNPFKIKNVGREDVEACCFFSYKGHIISASTIFKPHHVRIMLGEEFVGPHFNSIEDAIKEVDVLSSVSKTYYYCHHESECLWVSDPMEADGLVEEISAGKFDKLKSSGWVVVNNNAAKKTTRIHIWPDATWCHARNLDDYGWKSDDTRCVNVHSGFSDELIEELVCEGKL